ncbi:hypothetical protein OQ279_05425 [Salinimicrobium sp. MT39]|jgi:hypothetical protein|uniref:Uncharacterized protein n=1 Tax=Salinimicrobium profundisediminis TaxID=2994553 RepID=A0A9X3CW32_9FLAO|nr:hypothetical protein [Salinimicrobium profundisediminis]MCX2837588.1 hypothetical protein [Salinimicrobium profundisediminis]
MSVLIEILIAIFLNFLVSTGDEEVKPEQPENAGIEQVSKATSDEC